MGGINNCLDKQLDEQYLLADPNNVDEEKL